MDKLVVAKHLAREQAEATLSTRRCFRLPAIEGEVIQVQGRRSTRADAIDLEVGHQVSSRPAQRESGEYSFVDRSFDAVKPHRVVSDVAYGVARVADLDVMPDVRGPIGRIARLVGMKPFDNRILPRSRVGTVIPGIGGAGALESIDDRI